MSLNSFFSGLSGLAAQSTAINVIGDNLANLNTVAFKGSTVRFSDLVVPGSVGASGNPMQVGLGSNVSAITPRFEQGTLQPTGNPLDLALDGDGFFVLERGGTMEYSRAGNFQIAQGGDIITASGAGVMGWTVPNADGTIPASGTQTRINIPTDQTLAPQATTTLRAALNLDAGAPDGTIFSTALTVYDTLGEPHVVEVRFEKTGPGAWTYDMEVEGSEVAGGTPGTPVSIGSGTLTFDANGQLDPLTGVDGAPPADVSVGTGAVALANGAAPIAFSWDVVEAGAPASLTGFASPSVVRSVSQDGYTAGTLSSIQVDQRGVVLGKFSNGESKELARIAVARFPNSAGLLRMSGNSFAATRASGEATLGSAGDGGRGGILGGALEMSNVDIAEEFTALILAQRGYQASSRIITTTDELTQESINLKR